MCVNYIYFRAYNFNMKITIDTKEDSHSEIKKVINLLTHLLGEGGSEVLSSDETSEESASAFTNMFGNSEGSESTEESGLESTDDDTPDEDTPTDDGDVPEIVPY